MTEFATFTGKNVDEAVNNALLQLQITSEKLEYEVVEKGSNGLLGFIGSKPAVIRADRCVPNREGELHQRYPDHGV